MSELLGFERMVALIEFDILQHLRAQGAGIGEMLAHRNVPSSRSIPAKRAIIDHGSH